MEQLSTMDNLSPTFGEVLEALAKTVYESCDKDMDEWGKRMTVAMAFGYYDAKYMRFAKETYGLALTDSLIFFRKKWPNIRVPYSGLKFELELMGKKPSAVEAELKELQEFDMLYQQEKHDPNKAVRTVVSPQPEPQTDSTQQEVRSKGTGWSEADQPGVSVPFDLSRSVG